MEKLREASREASGSREGSLETKERARGTNTSVKKITLFADSATMAKEDDSKNELMTKKASQRVISKRDFAGHLAELTDNMTEMSHPDLHLKGFGNESMARASEMGISQTIGGKPTSTAIMSPEMIRGGPKIVLVPAHEKADSDNIRTTVVSPAPLPYNDGYSNDAKSSPSRLIEMSERKESSPLRL